MEAIQKKKARKSAVPTVADIGIMLECLYEVYGTEGELLSSGKNLRSTMAYPFVKMIESQCQGSAAGELHRLLWGLFLEGEGKSAFIQAAKERLAAYEKGEGE